MQAMKFHWGQTLRGAAFALVTALSVAGCAGNPTPPAREVPNLGFTNVPPFRLAASGPDVVSTFQATRETPHVEYLMPITPEQGTRTWAKDRIQPSGVGSDRVRVEIREASVIEKPLPTTGGLTGFFSNEPDLRYEGRLTVAVQILGSDGLKRAEVVASAWRTKELLEKASLAQREQLWFDLTEQLVKDIDAQFAQSLPNTFRQWVVSY